MNFESMFNYGADVQHATTMYCKSLKFVRHFLWANFVVSSLLNLRGINI
jgi:hypothetical protein